MEIITNPNFTHQIDTLFKTLARLRHKEVVSKEKLLEINEYIHQLYHEQNQTVIKKILYKTYTLAHELEEQSQDKTKTTQTNLLRKIKRNKQLAKNVGGKSP